MLTPFLENRGAGTPHLPRSVSRPVRANPCSLLALPVPTIQHQSLKTACFRGRRPKCTGHDPGQGSTGDKKLQIFSLQKHLFLPPAEEWPFVAFSLSWRSLILLPLVSRGSGLTSSPATKSQVLERRSRLSSARSLWTGSTNSWLCSCWSYQSLIINREESILFCPQGWISQHPVLVEHRYVKYFALVPVMIHSIGIVRKSVFAKKIVSVEYLCTTLFANGDLNLNGLVFGYFCS